MLRRTIRQAISTSSSTKMCTISPNSRMSTQVSRPSLFPRKAPYTDFVQAARKVCLAETVHSVDPTLTSCLSTTTGGWKGCIQAVLEIPQRRHLEEIQGTTTSRFFGYKEERRTPNTSCHTSSGKEERKGRAGSRVEHRCTCATSGSCRGIRGTGSIWINNSFCGSLLVSIGICSPGEFWSL